MLFTIPFCTMARLQWEEVEEAAIRHEQSSSFSLCMAAVEPPNDFAK